MRKLLLLTGMATFIAITAQAQINKGTVLLGGNISAGISKSSYTNTSTNTKGSGFSITPSLGFVTATNTAWGFNLSYSNGKGRSSNGTTENINDANAYGGGVFYRKYLTLGKGFYLFGQAGTGYNYSKLHEENQSNSYSSTTRSDYVYLTAYPGITYTVGKKLHLEIGLNDLVSLGYISSNTSNIGIGGSQKQKQFSFSSNLSNSNPFNVGFRFALGK